MIEKMQLFENKTLKITNALIRDIPSLEDMDEQRLIYMMESYIKSIGGRTKGPLISYASGITGIENGKPIVRTQLIMQLMEPVLHCDSHYIFQPLIRTGSCLFVRFTGNPNKLNFAYAKMGSYAYEKDIVLEGSSYTVFAVQGKENAVIDLFMPIKKEDNTDEAISSK